MEAAVLEAAVAAAIDRRRRGRLYRGVKPLLQLEEFFVYFAPS